MQPVLGWLCVSLPHLDAGWMRCLEPLSRGRGEGQLGQWRPVRSQLFPSHLETLRQISLGGQKKHVEICCVKSPRNQPFPSGWSLPELSRVGLMSLATGYGQWCLVTSVCGQTIPTGDGDGATAASVSVREEERMCCALPSPPSSTPWLQ